MSHLRRSPQRVAVAKENPISDVYKIQMGVRIDQVHGLLIIEGRDTGDVRRMVVTKNHGYGGSLQNLADTKLDFVVFLDGVRVDNIGIANIYDPDLVGRQIGNVLLEVIGAAMVEGEQVRGLADGPGAKPRASPRIYSFHKTELGIDPSRQVRLHDLPTDKDSYAHDR